MKRWREYLILLGVLVIVGLLVKDDLMKPNPVEQICENVRKSGATCVVSPVELEARVMQVSEPTGEEGAFLVILKDGQPMDIIRVR